MSLETNMNRECRDVWIFAEIQDHERVLEGALELLSKGRELADDLGERLCAVVYALDAEQYCADIARYGPDIIFCCSDPALKHYDSELFPELWSRLIREHRPSIVLFPATEAGGDLAPRLAQRFTTGLTSHCTDLEIIDTQEHGRLLAMKRPAYGGNAIATVVCPQARPQMATVQQGVFVRRERPNESTRIINIPFTLDLHTRKISYLDAPLRWDKPKIPLDRAQVVIAGGRGVASRKAFNRLFELAELLEGEVGSTRVPVFNGWCGPERMIGQTGKTVRPKCYIGFGVSGQIQHTTSIVDSECIISVNTDTSAPLCEMSDYVVNEDASEFLSALIDRLSRELKPGRS